MTLDLEPSVELTAGGVVLYIPAVTARLLLTPTQARDLAASLCAAADAHDDEYPPCDEPEALHSPAFLAGASGSSEGGEGPTHARTHHGEKTGCGPPAHESAKETSGHPADLRT